MGRKKKLSGNSDIPQHAIETIARCIFPDILAFYESDEGQREFAEWKRKQADKDNKDDNSRLKIQPPPTAKEVNKPCGTTAYGSRSIRRN